MISVLFRSTATPAARRPDPICVLEFTARQNAPGLPGASASNVFRRRALASPSFLGPGALVWVGCHVRCPTPSSEVTSSIISRLAVARAVINCCQARPDLQQARAGAGPRLPLSLRLELLGVGMAYSPGRKTWLRLSIRTLQATSAHENAGLCEVQPKLSGGWTGSRPVRQVRARRLASPPAVIQVRDQPGSVQSTSKVTRRGCPFRGAQEPTRGYQRHESKFSLRRICPSSSVRAAAAQQVNAREVNSGDLVWDHDR